MLTCAIGLCLGSVSTSVVSLLIDRRFSSSNSSNCPGAGTFFPDINEEASGSGGLKVGLGQGDAVLHSGKLEHAGLPIAAGTRYVLAGFFQLCFPCPPPSAASASMKSDDGRAAQPMRVRRSFGSGIKMMSLVGPWDGVS